MRVAGGWIGRLHCDTRRWLVPHPDSSFDSPYIFALFLQFRDNCDLHKEYMSEVISHLTDTCRQRRVLT